MGTVYSATQVNLNRKVAIKVLFEHTVQDQDFLRGFFREAQAAAAFTHQNIVQAYDVGHTEDDLYYFAMELVDGGDVLRMIKERGSIIYKDAIPVMIGIAEGLHYGNKNRQLTHGDLKPANILISKTGEAKLADLGLARMGGEIQGESDGIMLTPMYAAPEMILDKWNSGDPRADIYSFGASLYHMLAGHPPFESKSYKEILRMQVEEAHKPLKKIRAKIPQGVSDFVDHLLEKDPKERPQNWQEVIDTLRKLQLKATTYTRLNNNPKSKVHERASKRNKNSNKTLLAVISIILIVGCLGILLIKIDSQKDPLEALREEALKDAQEKQAKQKESPENPKIAEQINSNIQNDAKSTQKPKAEDKKMQLTKAERRESKKERKNNLAESKKKLLENQKTINLEDMRKAEEKAAKKKQEEAQQAKLATHLKAIQTSPRSNFFAHIKKISELHLSNPYLQNLNIHAYEACKLMSEFQQGPIYIKRLSNSEITFVEEKFYGPLQSTQNIKSSSSSDKLAQISSHIYEKNLSEDKNITVFYAITHPQKIDLDRYLEDQDKDLINFLRLLKAKSK